MPTDPYASHGRSPGAPARRAAPVTPSDTVDLPTWAKALYLGEAGDVRLIPAGAEGDTAVTLSNHPVGYLPVQTRRVLATGTTAAGVVALYD